MTDYNNNRFDDDTTTRYDFDDGIEFLDDTDDNYYESSYDDSEIPRFSSEQQFDDSKNNHNKSQKTSIGAEILSYVKILAIAVIVAFLFTRFIIVNAQVPSGSMENTILTGDRLIGFRLHIFSVNQSVAIL